MSHKDVNATKSST